MYYNTYKYIFTLHFKFGYNYLQVIMYYKAHYE